MTLLHMPFPAPTPRYLGGRQEIKLLVKAIMGFCFCVCSLRGGEQGSSHSVVHTPHVSAVARAGPRSPTWVAGTQQLELLLLLPGVDTGRKLESGLKLGPEFGYLNPYMYFVFTDHGAILFRLCSGSQSPSE